jgi:hypothetical protein
LPILIAAYSNCSDPKFETDSSYVPLLNDRSGLEGDGDAPGSNDPGTDVVVKACSANRIKTKVVQVRFADPQDKADPTKTCEFNKNGNLGPKNDFFQARVEQNVEFDLPAGSKICDMEFTMPEQQMKYDDHLFLVFDDAILGSSYPVEDRMPTRDGIMTYSWSELGGTGWPRGNFKYVYCLGMEQGYSKCVWPETQVEGKMSMQFNPIVFQAITARNLNRTHHQFKLVTTGDNDPQSDCQHEPIAFDALVSYVD